MRFNPRKVTMALGLGLALDTLCLVPETGYMISNDTSPYKIVYDIFSGAAFGKEEYSPLAVSGIGLKAAIGTVMAAYFLDKRRRSQNTESSDLL